MATTPPPPTTLRTPPTPRHGAGYEGYDPYVTRHSSRIASRRAAAKSHTTPPPSSPTELQAPAGVPTERDSQPKPSAMGALSPPSSNQNSPRKTPGSRVKVVPGNSLYINNERHLPSNTNTSPHTTQNKNTFTHNNPATMADDTLPTPTKTPRKKMVPDPKQASRVLFPNKPPTVPEDLQDQKDVKKGKKYSAFSLESFNENGGIEPQGSVPIFTDSRDRIPELDESEDNPFYQKPDATKDSEVKSNTTPRTTKRRKVDETGNTKRDKEVQEAIKRDDGMFYVFRGKKIFRKFDSGSDDQGEDDDEGLLAGRSGMEDVNSNTRPLTRASVKPRLLFPTSEQRQAREEKSVVTDEEATTDIEELADADEMPEAPSNEPGNEPSNEVGKEVATESEPTTPTNQTTTSPITTPSTPRFSGHSLRSHSKRDVDETPVKGDRANANASFEAWKRTKSNSDDSANSTPKAKKRGFPSGDRSTGPAKKKARGN